MDPIAELVNVTMERGKRTILSGVNWRIETGQQWVIMGSNGSGKTSLLALLTGYQWPSQGQVSVLGHRFGTVDLRELRKKIGFVSHQLAEWMTRDHGHVPVRELVQSGRSAMVGKSPLLAPEEEVEEVLQQFELERLARAAFSGLSQGEKTRVLLARAWMAEIELLILDEPCSGLDIRGREHLLKFVQRYLDQSHRHLIYVTHHPEEILPGFTHALLLKDGRIYAQGPRGDVLTDALLSQALGVPLHIEELGGRPWLQVLPVKIV